MNWVVGENGWAHSGPFGNEELQSKCNVVGCTMTSQITVAIKPIVFGQTDRIFARVSTLASDIDLPV